MEMVYSILLLKLIENQKPLPIIQREIDIKEYQLIQEKFKDIKRQTFAIGQNNGQVIYEALQHEKNNCFKFVTESAIYIPQKSFLKIIGIFDGKHTSDERYELLKKAIMAE